MQLQKFGEGASEVVQVDHDYWIEIWANEEVTRQLHPYLSVVKAQALWGPNNKTARKWLEIACSGMDRAETNSLYIVYAGYLCRSDILTVLHRDRLWQGTDNSARSACVLSCGLCTRAFFRSWSRSKMFQLLQSGKLRMNVRAASRSCAAEMVDGIRKQWQKDGTKCMCPCNDHND